MTSLVVEQKFHFSVPIWSASITRGQVDTLMDPKIYPEWQESLLKRLVSTTKAVSLVGGHDVAFERSIDAKFDTSLTAVTDRLLNLSNRLLKFAGLQEDEFESEDDFEDRWGDVVDVVDSLLERAVIFHFFEEGKNLL